MALAVNEINLVYLNDVILLQSEDDDSTSWVPILAFERSSSHGDIFIVLADSKGDAFLLFRFIKGNLEGIELLASSRLTVVAVQHQIPISRKENNSIMRQALSVDNPASDWNIYDEVLRGIRYFDVREALAFFGQNKMILVMSYSDSSSDPSSITLVFEPRSDVSAVNCLDHNHGFAPVV